MKYFIHLIAIVSLCFFLSCEKEDELTDSGNQDTVIVIDSNEDSTIIVKNQYQVIKVYGEFGEIYLWLFDETPIHKERFIWLTANGFFDNQTFNRIVNNFVVQGGNNLDTVSNLDTVLEQSTYEKVDGLVHQLGALGAARTGDDVNPQRLDMGDQWYICEEISLEDAARLDTGYVIFGQVISDLSVITDLGKTPVSFLSNDPVDPVYMQADTVTITESFIQDSLGFNLDSLMLPVSR